MCQKTEKLTKTVRNGSKSIGFGWGRAQSEREDMPLGPCDGPDASTGRITIVFIDFRKLEHQDVQHA
jgi:hypothetical protein